jgi:hypothetical protein
LRCKSERCAILIRARETFKLHVGKILHLSFEELEERGFSRKECVRAMRREILHRNRMQQDVFDEIANNVWGSTDNQKT